MVRFGLATIIILGIVLFAFAIGYYGNFAWRKGSLGAKASTLINQRNQINTAVALYKSNYGVPVKNIQSLVDENYFTDIPVFNDYNEWGFSKDVAYVFLTENIEEATNICNLLYYKEDKNVDNYYNYGFHKCNEIEPKDVCCLGNTQLEINLIFYFNKMTGLINSENDNLF